MNQISIVGRLAQDPTLTYGQNKARSFFNLAVDRRTTSTTDNVDWIPVTCFGPLAEAVADHVGKGRQVAVTGHLRSSRYEQDGRTVFRLEVIADQIDFLSRPHTPAEPADGDQAA